MTETALHHEGWHGRLSLGFSRRDRRTVLSRRSHFGPLQVQRPFYPESNGTCHVYLLHPPGGVVGGDSLDTHVEVDSKAQALVTTPAATKFYRGQGRVAQVRQCLSLATAGVLEWFPQETIVYSGADGQLFTRVDIDGEACFSGWEITCFGRPAARERFHQGHYRQRFEIWRAGVPLWLEHSQVRGGEDVLQSNWGMGGFSVTATFAMVGGIASDAPTMIRQALAERIGDAWLSVTLMDDVLVGRYLGHQAEAAKDCFTRVWELMRPMQTGRAICRPRIWDT